MTARHMDSHRHVALGVAALAVAGLLSGCSAGAQNQPSAPAPTGTASSATAPSEPAASSPAPEESAGTALEDSVPYKALTPEQQSKIASLEALDMSTFEKQSRDDQLAYGAFLREVYQGEAIAGIAEKTPKATVPVATKVSETSSGAEIVGDEFLKAATARRSVQADPAVADAGARGGSNYAKMAPSRVAPLYPASYAEAAAPTESTVETALSRLSDPGRMSLAEESNTFIPYDGSWEQLEFKVIQMQDTESQANSQFYFAFTPFTNIHGTQDGVWVLMLNAGEAEEKWIPDLSVID